MCWKYGCWSHRGGLGVHCTWPRFPGSAGLFPPTEQGVQMSLTLVHGFCGQLQPSPGRSSFQNLCLHSTTSSGIHQTSQKIRSWYFSLIEEGRGRAWNKSYRQFFLPGKPRKTPGDSFWTGSLSFYSIMNTMSETAEEKSQEYADTL